MDRVHRQDGVDLLTRAVAPGVALGGLIIGIGFALKGPLDGLSHAEESVNKDLAGDRNGTWNTITAIWSQIGNTAGVIAVCIVVSSLLLWRTRDLRLALVAPVAIAMQGLIFLITAKLVDRDRPQVERLDPSPPTASYPSGHTGASTGLYVALALLALRIERTWLRWTTVILCLAMPLLVAFARLYRGMHHVTDVSAGILNGAICALLAYAWYSHCTNRR
ncbi:phosphatase PAP2 family protein [Kribbella kalugense]|uniref:Undecaprenyl-diphosphatase n=1 Tax=Kribbella kalugense TaxID=2512221 RepID=A0A4R8A2W7_9ACTN|nr:phosphatase PAP2 family protein [Kribbella kalugense]TDW23738.1 undecaprenyl-diphosphatase [Kribbella kalugense]